MGILREHWLCLPFGMGGRRFPFGTVVQQSEIASTLARLRHPWLISDWNEKQADESGSLGGQ